MRSSKNFRIQKNFISYHISIRTKIIACLEIIRYLQALIRDDISLWEKILVFRMTVVERYIAWGTVTTKILDWWIRRWQNDWSFRTGLTDSNFVWFKKISIILYKRCLSYAKKQFSSKILHKYFVSLYFKPTDRLIFFSLFEISIDLVSPIPTFTKKLLYRKGRKKWAKTATALLSR